MAGGNGPQPAGARARAAQGAVDPARVCTHGGTSGCIARACRCGRSRLRYLLPSCDRPCRRRTGSRRPRWPARPDMCSFHPSPGRPRPSLKECSPPWFCLRSRCLAPGSFRPGLWREASAQAPGRWHRHGRRRRPGRASRRPFLLRRCSHSRSWRKQSEPPPPASAPAAMQYQVVPAEHARYVRDSARSRIAWPSSSASLTCCSSSGSATSIPRCILRKGILQENRACPSDRFPRHRATLPAGTQATPLPPPTAPAENRATLPPQPAPETGTEPVRVGSSPDGLASHSRNHSTAASSRPACHAASLSARPAEPANQPPPLQPLPTAREAAPHPSRTSTRSAESSRTS